ncbi:2,3-diaminopropionate biosynthesis protein SbnB [Bacillus cereus]|uniref:2,3-diaminopropionate biosynthesis protein SbnB n=1 Tax=Bacillus cereus TaxID=1396 RepID=UPI003CFD6FA3
MLYLSESDCKQMSIDWNETIDVIEQSVYCIEKEDYAQPIKPYLRYGNSENRIIAMPAFVGKPFNQSGIKWISSFPKNLSKDIPRAHSTIILNNTETGQPVSVINGAFLSIIRTASVSGLLIKKYIEARNKSNIKIGIVGFGPIGKNHLKMCKNVLGDRLDKVYLYDIRGIDKQDLDSFNDMDIAISNSWEDVYLNSDIFLTCTVSKDRYINKQAQPGSLLLNVSLRDYQPDAIDINKDLIIVDDWDEVARENTDIEKLKDIKGLKQEDCKTLVDVVRHNCLEEYESTKTVMFNPMGMSIFDIAISSHYYNKAIEEGIGVVLQ